MVASPHPRKATLWRGEQRAKSGTQGGGVSRARAPINLELAQRPLHSRELARPWWVLHDLFWLHICVAIPAHFCMHALSCFPIETTMIGSRLKVLPSPLFHGKNLFCTLFKCFYSLSLPARYTEHQINIEHMPFSSSYHASTTSSRALVWVRS